MPQVQYLDIPTWGQALGEFGGGFLDQFMTERKAKKERGDIADIVNQLPEDASEEDVIKAVFGSGKLSPDRAKTVSDVIGGAKRKKVEADIEREKIGASKSKIEADEQAKADRITFEKEREEARNERARLDRESRENVAATKGSKQSEFDKTLSREYAKQYAQIQEQLPKYQSAQQDLDYLSEISDKITGLSGYAKLGTRSEFDAIAASTIEPMIKMYNPTGAVAARKLDWINKTFKPSSLDTTYTTRGKIAGLKRIFNAQQNKLMERQKLIESFNGNPPAGAMEAFDRQSEEEYDKILKEEYRKQTGKDLEDKTKVTEQDMKMLPNIKSVPPGKKVRLKDGREFRVVNGEWEAA